MNGKRQYDLCGLLFYYFIFWPYCFISWPYNVYMIKKHEKENRKLELTPEMMDKKIKDIKKFYNE